MKNTLTHNFTKIATLAGIFTIALVSNYLYAAWSEPTASPTGDNTLPPLDEGAVAQSKGGGISLTSLIIGYGKLQIQDGTQGKGNVLVSNDAGVASWKATSSLVIDGGAGGSISSLTQGSGIKLSPNPITDTGTIKADTGYLQRRVKNACPAGQAMASVQSNGSPQCVTLPPSNSCTYNGLKFSPGASCYLGYYGCFACVDAHHYQTCQTNGTWQHGSFSSNISTFSKPPDCS